PEFERKFYAFPLQKSQHLLPQNLSVLLIGEKLECSERRWTAALSRRGPLGVWLFAFVPGSLLQLAGSFVCMPLRPQGCPR
ncbi:MAG: hypothetical protein K6C08_10485, partial [Oscillospiraceae bacterium]|nr:hypothetical protein [Oscillospiraceae bacterium]